LFAEITRTVKISSEATHVAALKDLRPLAANASTLTSVLAIHAAATRHVKIQAARLFAAALTASLEMELNAQMLMNVALENTSAREMQNASIHPATTSATAKMATAATALRALTLMNAPTSLPVLARQYAPTRTALSSATVKTASLTAATTATSALTSMNAKQTRALNSRRAPIQSDHFLALV